MQLLNSYYYLIAQKDETYNSFKLLESDSGSGESQCKGLEIQI